jgi:hypothetical protein
MGLWNCSFHPEDLIENVINLLFSEDLIENVKDILFSEDIFLLLKTTQI